MGFLVTARCNAACTHCTVDSGPRRTTSLAAAKVLALIDEAVAIWQRQRTRREPLHIGISGGEPFLAYDGLVQAVAHGSRLGATMTCVSNGFWASSDDKARDKLLPLKQAGLSMLAISTSRFHQQFVKLDRVERALAIAKASGLKTALKCVITAGDRRDGELEAWARARAVDQLEIFPVMPYLRSGAELPEATYIRERRLPRGRCPAATLAIREDGRAYTCCQPGGLTEFLKVGDVHEAPLETIYEDFYLNGVQQVLRERGPIHFARALDAQGLGHRLRDRYEGVCDLCAHIANDPEMASGAQRVADAFAQQEFRRVSRRFRQSQARAARHSRKPGG